MFKLSRWSSYILGRSNRTEILCNNCDNVAAIYKHEGDDKGFVFVDEKSINGIEGTKVYLKRRCPKCGAFMRLRGRVVEL